MAACGILYGSTWSDTLTNDLMGDVLRMKFGWVPLTSGLKNQLEVNLHFSLRVSLAQSLIGSLYWSLRRDGEQAKP